MSAGKGDPKVKREKGDSFLIVRKTRRERISLTTFRLDEADLAKDIRKRALYAWKRYNDIYDIKRDKLKLNEVMGEILRNYWRILKQKRPDSLDYGLTRSLERFYQKYGYSRLERNQMGEYA